jgi:Fe-S-cluster containining protein
MLEDCRLCGACCLSDSSAYVSLTDADVTRLAAPELIHVEAGARFMAMRDGRCAALETEGGAFRCAVYARRPAICRGLAHGSLACREERQLKRRAAQRLLTLR